MNDLLTRRLSILGAPEHKALLAQGLRGIERETLRVNKQGYLVRAPYPLALGSALTHEQITTDYSESLLEFITPAVSDIAQALQRMDEIHRFVHGQLQGEVLWNTSMPCILPAEEDIPIAWYGTSHIGMLKHVYRRGLALRYGKAMQCIAGIHYNFSLNEKLWKVLCKEDGADPAISDQDYQSEQYIALIRNFRRYSWLLMYLFGASPVLSSNFLQGRTHQLEALGKESLYYPYATSLRMGDLGYQSNAQASITPHYNNLHSYIRSLARAVSQPYPAYEAIGTKQKGEWVQINTNILQIENEYYSSIRPKRVINSGERPIHALSKRGVQYVEVRCMDIDPFDPLGLSLQTARFLDVFLHFIALEESPLTSDAEAAENNQNFKDTVKMGRRPGLQLQRHMQPVPLQTWGLELLDRMQAVAALLDNVSGSDEHQQALSAQRAKLHDVALTPSACVLEAIKAAGNSFVTFVLQQSQQQAADFLARPLSAQQQADFIAMADASIAAQAQIEQEQTGDFDAFITAYSQSALANIVL